MSEDAENNVALGVGKFPRPGTAARFVRDVNKGVIAAPHPETLAKRDPWFGTGVPKDLRDRPRKVYVHKTTDGKYSVRQQEVNRDVPLSSHDTEAEANSYAELARRQDISLHDRDRQQRADGGPVAGASPNYQEMMRDQQRYGNSNLLGSNPGWRPHDLITTAKLKSSVDEALAEHWSLDQRQRKLHSVMMRGRVAQHFPTAEAGKHGSILTTTAKMDKDKLSPEEKAHPIMQGKDGFLTTGLAFSPAYRVGNFNFCNNSVGCWRACLGVKSGQYGASSEGGNPNSFAGNARIASLRRSHAFINDPGAFAVRLDDALQSAKNDADSSNKRLGMRLNILSDIHPDVWRSLYDHYPDVSFYDYTKNATKQLGIPNHHLTHSLRGSSHPVGYNGVTGSAIDSPFQNWNQMRERITRGENVAIPFAHRKLIPQYLHDEESGLMVPVIDGDRHDFRPLDPKQANGHGVIVGLRDKINQGRPVDHPRETHGVMFPYDPKPKLDAKGNQVMVDSGKRRSDGKPVMSPVATNDAVTMAPQGARRTVTKHADGSVAPPDQQYAVGGRVPFIRGDDQVPLTSIMPDDEYMFSQFANSHMYRELNEAETAALKEPGDSRRVIWRGSFADGGSTTTETTAAPSNPRFHAGPIHSAVAGRTDHLPITVESGSYVLPADIVSAGGSGNTLAGFKVLRRTFGGSPYNAGNAPYGQSKGVYGLPVTYASGGKVCAAGIVFMSPDKKILLMRRTGDEPGADHVGEWALPAGKLERGETPEQAARRETREEAGYDHDGGLSPLMHSDDERVDFTTYLAHSRRFEPTLNNEHDRAKWVALDEAQKLPLHPGVRAALDKLAQRTRKAGGGASSGVPIVAAGGEWVIPPEHVRHVGGGDLDMGHKVLDAFVHRVRSELIGTLRKLPPPKKD